MSKLKIFLIALTIFLFACDVNFSELAVPNNRASYTLKIVDEQYDIATEMMKYATGISKNDSGALCVDTTIVYSKSSGFSFKKVSFSALSVNRVGPYYLSDIDSKNFIYSLGDMNANWKDLGSGTSVSFSSPLTITNLSKNNNTDIYSPYNFKNVNVNNAVLRVTATNDLGFPLSSLTATVCDSSGRAIKEFVIGAISKGSSGSGVATISSSENILYPQFISVKVNVVAPAQPTNIELSNANKLKIAVSFDTITGKQYQIEASDYYGYAPADTVSINWKQAFSIDKNNDGRAEFDIYNFTATSSTVNNLTMDFVTNCDNLVNVDFVFPGIYNSSSRNDTLKRKVEVYKVETGSDSTTRTNKLSLSSKYFGETYSTSSPLFDSIKVLATVTFPKSNTFVQVSQEKVKISLVLDSLELNEMTCKIKEDVVYGGVSGTIPVSLNRFYVTDKDGREVSEVDLLGPSDISYTMNRTIRTQSGILSDFIRLKTNMGSSRNSNSRTYTDSVSLGISSSLATYYEGELPKDTSFLNLLKILPENFSYLVSPTIKASNSIVVIDASKNLSLNVKIKTPIKFNTSGDNLIFELRNDYGSGLEGMYKKFTSAQITSDVYKNYIDGKLVLTYKNTSNMTLGAKVIFSTDKSVLYNDNIITTATSSTVGTSGYPSYIARVINFSNILPNTSSGSVSASLTQNDLEPLLKDTCYIGVKIPIKSSSASFSGELDLVGKILFDYNNLGDL